MKTQVMAGEKGRGGGWGASRGDSHSEKAHRRREGSRVRPGQEEEGSAQNMVVSYLVLIVRLDSLGSTSHVVLPWD